MVRELIFDDGEPLESNRHRIAMNTLIRLMLVAKSGQTDYFTSEQVAEALRLSVDEINRNVR